MISTHSSKDIRAFSQFLLGTITKVYVIKNYKSCKTNSNRFAHLKTSQPRKVLLKRVKKDTGLTNVFNLEVFNGGAKKLGGVLSTIRMSVSEN